MLQSKLNVTSVNPRLVCDKSFGPKTSAALLKYTGGSTVCDEKVWDSLFNIKEVDYSGQAVDIICKSVNIRDADSTKGKILGIAHKGEAYPYFGPAPSGWYTIKYLDRLAYISNRVDLTKVGTLRKVKVLGGSVYVRSSGSKLGKILGVVHKGDEFELIKTSKWYAINYKDKLGYISNRSDLTKLI
jgi:hypothetical protein